jgi:hypothetical protein
MLQLMNLAFCTHMHAVVFQLWLALFEIACCIQFLITIPSLLPVVQGLDPDAYSLAADASLLLPSLWCDAFVFGLHIETLPNPECFRRARLVGTVLFGHCWHQGAPKLPGFTMQQNGTAFRRRLSVGGWVVATRQNF